MLISIYHRILFKAYLSNVHFVDLLSLNSLTKKGLCVCFNLVYLMASSGCVHVTFFDTLDKSFIFEVVQPDTDLEEDDFKRNEHHWCIKNQQDGIGCLILNNEEQDKSVCQQEFGNKFHIVTYRSNSLDTMEKMPVMMYAVKNGQEMVVCYKNMTVQAEDMTPPLHISGLNHMALFYQTKLPGTNRFKFVSSVDQKKVLGVAHVENDLYKLVMVDDGDDHIDESAVFGKLP